MNDNPLGSPIAHFFIAAVVTFIGMFILVPVFFGFVRLFGFYTIVEEQTRMALHDTRNMAFGVLPLIEDPGGDEAGDFGMENMSVRKNFAPCRCMSRE